MISGALWILLMVAVNINGELIHKRPRNGIGPFLLSHDDSHLDYNDKTVMITFNKKCLNGDSSVQDSKIDSIISHFDGCLSKHHTTTKHFQYSHYGVSFLNFDGIDCISKYNNFDYDLHCVDMFSYEPVFYLNSFTTNYTVFTDTSQYSCQSQLTTSNSLPSGWAWGLGNLDSLTNDNLFSFPIVNS